MLGSCAAVVGLPRGPAACGCPCKRRRGHHAPCCTPRRWPTLSRRCRSTPAGKQEWKSKGGTSPHALQGHEGLLSVAPKSSPSNRLHVQNAKAVAHRAPRSPRWPQANGLQAVVDALRSVARVVNPVTRIVTATRLAKWLQHDSHSDCNTTRPGLQHDSHSDCKVTSHHVTA